MVVTIIIILLTEFQVLAYTYKLRIKLSSTLSTRTGSLIYFHQNQLSLLASSKNETHQSYSSYERRVRQWSSMIFPSSLSMSYFVLLLTNITVPLNDTPMICFAAIFSCLASTGTSFVIAGVTVTIMKVGKIIKLSCSQGRKYSVLCSFGSVGTIPAFFNIPAGKTTSEIYPPNDAPGMTLTGIRIEK
ncbi:hypothetical protein COCMIDRAFT_29479 [Bipolaris oryzae ATCC 44560]|uniref:Uncharacterized protein n=1 Tax=Bipolaris oryzae ATCC 44560 TaxID=930090 RepID=W6ZE38_COCMI|nr:uncharacterized protein COCMIDRAFT_29479 [Bipolaris oryzae ATCC 44560]EUC41781.1 hypothetical protein COCMIDRAFT_29479 [Bipolaris oryzae ATCC 44560]